MIPSLPRPRWLKTANAVYVAAFLAFLFLPLVVVAIFAFNNAPYPAPPWRGFTLDWFLGNAGMGRVGLFGDTELLGSIWTSCVVAFWVTLLSVLDRDLERVSHRARPLRRQASPFYSDAGTLGDSGCHPGHLDSRLRQPRRAVHGRPVRPRLGFSAAGVAAGRLRAILRSSQPSRRSPSARGCAASTARSRKLR